MSDAIEILGWDAVAKKLGVAVQLLMDSARAVAVAEGCELMELAQRDVPVQTGALRDSAYVSEPVVDGSRVVVEAGYAATYAGARHETGADHRQWFLSASSVFGLQFPERFASAMRSALSGGSVPARTVTSTPRRTTGKVWSRKSSSTRSAIRERGKAMRRAARG